MVMSCAVETYSIDLRKIEGEGDIKCMKCGTSISPDDISEKTYTVVNVKENKEELMEEMTIQCLICKSEIHLTGFTELYTTKTQTTNIESH